ncbi:MAG: hypothetical protein AABX70_05875 [Nanoarchaeota archaeon]
MVDEKKLFERLDRIAKLIAAVAIQGKNLKEQVNLLSGIGLQPSEIAEIIGKSPNLVRVTKASLKKEKAR